MLKNITTRDALALILILGYIFLSWRGAGTMLNAAVLIIIGFYFGAEHQKNNVDAPTH